MKITLFYLFTLNAYSFISKIHPLHAVYSGQKHHHTIVSLFSENHYKSGLSDRIEQLYRKNSKPGNKSPFVELGKTTSKKIFKELEITPNQTIFTYDLNSQNLKEYPLAENRNIIINENSAVQGLGTFGIKIPKQENIQHTLAYIGKKNPFIKGQMKKITWIPSSHSYGHILKAQKDWDHVKNTSFEFSTEDFNFYLTKHVFTKIGAGYSDLGAYFRIENKAGKILKEIKGSGNYFSLPKDIWVGRLFKNQKIFLYSDSFQMGCASLIELSTDQPSPIEVTCGSWGC